MNLKLKVKRAKKAFATYRALSFTIDLLEKVGIFGRSGSRIGDYSTRVGWRGTSFRGTLPR